MRCTLSSFRLAADASSAPSMSVRPTYRGGRNQCRRGVSRGSLGGRGRFPTRGWQSQSATEPSLGFRQGDTGSFERPAGSTQKQPCGNNYPPRASIDRRPAYNQPQQPSFNQQPPPAVGGSHWGRQPLPYHPNYPRPSLVLQSFHPRHRKTSDHRKWEYARHTAPPEGDGFIILSFNILADYLAIDHRSRLYNHIPLQFLEWNWRKRRILFELGLWSADVLCFQEIDRFEDMKEDLKVMGYDGIWKMRTGNAKDGCAIFWRSSRFKLLHEECIEFNKLGLRDNVAQICVLEFLSLGDSEKGSASSSSSQNSHKIVVCNIHLLYNPSRGEIKLGQVRELLNRAHGVSQLWNNAPVVLCGDFNCTPKSPLYNFILEQKLNLAELDRDKVSGQASAQIHAPMQHKLDPRHCRSQFANESNQVRGRPGQSNSVLNIQKQNNSISSTEEMPLMKGLSPLVCKNDELNLTHNSCVNEQYGGKSLSSFDEVTINVLSNNADGSKGRTDAAVCDCGDMLNESPSEVNPLTNENDETEPGAALPCEVTRNDFGKADTSDCQSNKGLDSSLAVDFSTNARNDVVPESIPNSNASFDPFKHISTSPAAEAPPSESSRCSYSLSTDNDKMLDKSTQFSFAYTNNGFALNEKPEDFSFQHQDEDTKEAVNLGEDCNQFLSELHNAEDCFPPDFCKSLGDNIVDQLKFDVPQNLMLHGPDDEVAHDLSPGMNSVPVDAERTYDPSKWAPLDIKTATGNAACTLLEHPLKLKSTYTEAEDCSGARDASGEPIVTSYNRGFLGTVDYIWRSEGLQTVRVLAPIRKDAMQWTRGFPTKKWGSDHIALASELAFTEDVHPDNAEIQ